MKHGQVQQNQYEKDEENYKKYSALLAIISGKREETEFVDVLDNIGNYIPTDSDEGVQELEEKAGIILGIVTSIGMVVSVIMPAILGIKYMLGSIEEKAEYKKDMVPYLVGAFLLFGICTIVKILQGVGQSINNI